MQPNVIRKTLALSDGREIIIESGKLARQADGSAVVRLGNTMLLATVVSRKEGVEGATFMPLSVDYIEKFSAAGKFPGGFIKREGRLSDHEILVSRLVDRALRPLFPDDYHAETQVNIYLISADSSVMPDALAALAASSALAVSDIPFNGPISEVRVVKSHGEYLVNPITERLDVADIDLIVGATIDNITMVEGELNEASEEDMLEALKVAHEAIKEQCRLQIELSEAAGKTVKRSYSHETNDEELRRQLQEQFYPKYLEVARRAIPVKKERSEAFKAIEEEYINSLPEDHTVDLKLASRYLHDIEKKASRDLVLQDNIRLDGRKPDEIRPIWCEVDYLPTAHGSAVFTRGETQSLTSVTLGTKLDEQMIDLTMISGSSKFLLHYNFPGFSTGEVKINRGPGRREIGHGNLANRALKKVVPQGAENPYTIRIVSDILESNGSSSMATVCAGSLALMDSGINLKSHVSGIAMGMISDPETGKFAILSDILGDEDHLGDMDFKICGTEKGITACQMDIKIDGLSYEVLKLALEQAMKGRLHILEILKNSISTPRAEYKPNVPRFVTLTIDKEFIGAVIGPGGKVVQEIQRETGATLVIEEINNQGLVHIYSVDQKGLEDARQRVTAITAVPQVGEVYDGIVKSIMPFGAFVEFMPGKEGLLHISEIKWERVETMDGLMEIGEEIKVKLTEHDKKTGKYRLSRKVLLPRPPRPEPKQQPN